MSTIDPRVMTEQVWYRARLKKDAPLDIRKKLLGQGEDTDVPFVNVIRIPSSIPVRRYAHGKFFAFVNPSLYWGGALSIDQVEESFEITSDIPPEIMQKGLTKALQRSMRIKTGSMATAMAIQAVIHKYS